jgi:hypothetical protein
MGLDPLLDNGLRPLVDSGFTRDFWRRDVDPPRETH